MRRYALTVVHRVRAASDALRTSFFFLPAAAVVLGFLGARLLVGVDVGDWVGQSTVDSARAVLATTAAATITFASITFSVSLLIMQQGSSQFSPRVIHGLVRDPFNRRVIAVVVGTFTYCLVSLQRVRGPVAEGGEEVVPELAVAVGLLLGVFAVLAVVAAINHTSRKMDVSVILGDIVDQVTGMPTSPDADDEIQATTRPDRSIPEGDPVTVVRFAGDGWVRQIDRRGLLSRRRRGRHRSPRDRRRPIRHSVDAVVHHLAGCGRSTTRGGRSFCQALCASGSDANDD